MGADRSEASPATDAAAALLGRLVERGVRHVVLSPGSRSQALALVAAELEQRGLIDLHVRVDERVAGFTALGIGRETGMPAAVVCTSGTATANLLPAVMEADHAGVPLLLLTADRPPELRGIGANQTTRQVGMFAGHVRFERDMPVPDAVDPVGGGEQGCVVRDAVDEALAAAVGTVGPRGPVHLNLPYREPLSGVLDPASLPTLRIPAVAQGPDEIERSLSEERSDESKGAQGRDIRGPLEGREADPARSLSEERSDESKGAQRPDEIARSLSEERSDESKGARGPDVRAGQRTLARGPRTVVVAGADAGPPAEQLSHDGGWPLVAEIVSGARFGRNVVHGYRALLADPELGGRIQRAVVLGHPTLSREVAALLRRTDVEVIAVDGPGERLNLNGSTVAAASVTVADGDIDTEWLGEWMRASRAALADLAPPAPDAERLASAVPRERLGAIAAEVEVARTPLTRELLVDAVWRASWPHDRLMFGSSRLVRVADAILPGKKVPVHANRGLAGIDGTIATAIGIAAASQGDGAPGVTRVLLGDLALLHDVGALLLPEGEPAPRIQVIVGNDGGGTIFDGLEVAASAGGAAMRRVMYTPQRVDFAGLSAAYGWAHERVATRAALDAALTGPTTGPRIIEVPLDR